MCQVKPRARTITLVYFSRLRCRTAPIRAAQPAVAADALRARDRCYFAMSFRAECHSDSDGAPLNGSTLGGSKNLVSYLTCAFAFPIECYLRSLMRVISWLD